MIAAPEQLAQSCLDWLRDKALQVLPEQELRGEDGFAWWPGPVRQSVTASTIAGSDGVLVRVWTDVAEVTQPLPAARLQMLNDRGTFSAISADGTLRLSASMRVYPELFSWQIRLLSYIAALQVAEASDVLSDGIAQVTPLADASAEIPASFDEIVGVRPFLARRSGELAAALQDVDVLHDAAQVINGQVQTIPHLRDAYSVTRPWSILPPEALPSFGGTPVRSAVSMADHPQVGAGLGVRTWFPLSVDQAVMERITPVLNRMDHGFAIGNVGAWLDFGTNLLISTFLPAGVCADPSDGVNILANLLSYHERMLYPALEMFIDAREGV